MKTQSSHPSTGAIFSANLLIAIAVALTPALWSCGGSQRAYAPASVEAGGEQTLEPHDEIALLWREIEQTQGGGREPDVLETAAAPEAMGQDDSEDEEDYDGDAEAGMSNDAPVAAGSHEPRAVSAARVRRRPVAEVNLVCTDGSEPPFATCSDSCRIAQSICNNAESICRLANELPGDDWASGKCRDARGACGDATEACCGCSGPDSK